MSNNASPANMADVKEGFLCPFCLEDMGTMNRLRSHFQKEHSNEPKINQFLREFYGRAKEIVNMSDSETKTSIRKEVLHSLNIYNTQQELGATRSHMERFTAIRNRRLEGFAAETNKLIIRLDKLLMNLPSDPSKRKLHEQTIVPWIETEDVSRCPECTKVFHLARRKHHCRLCGGIMCHDCSCFLSISKAKNVLSYHQSETSNESEANGDAGFRICQYCLNLLESRELMKASRNCKPAITELYDVMRSHVKDLDEKVEMFEKMSRSLNEGKITYHLSDARELWEKIIKLSERISAMSTKIASLNVTEDVNSLTDKQLKLQKAVSMSMNAYIQSKILNLQPLPTNEDYKKLKDERSRRIDEEIRREKREDLTDSLLASQVTNEVLHGSKTPQQRTQTTPSIDRGWVPETGTTRFNRVDDPLIEQMNNIRSFIKQAREACRYDEVKNLEDHLKELQEEHYRQQS